MNIQFRTILSFLFLFNLGPIILFLPSDASETYCSINSIEGCKESEKLSGKFYESFYGNHSFMEDSVSFTSQIKSYFGVNGFKERTMSKDAITLWKRFKIESSKQTSGPRKKTQDIPNGFNGSLLKF